MQTLSINNNSLNATPESAEYSAISNHVPFPKPKSISEESWKRSSTSAAIVTGERWKSSSNKNSSKNEKEESWKMSSKPRHAQLTSFNKENPRHSSSMMLSSGFNTPLSQQPQLTKLSPAEQCNDTTNQHQAGYADYSGISSTPAFHLSTSLIQSPFATQQPLVTSPLVQPYPPQHPEQYYYNTINDHTNIDYSSPYATTTPIDYNNILPVSIMDGHQPPYTNLCINNSGSSLPILGHNNSSTPNIMELYTPAAEPYKITLSDDLTNITTNTATKKETNSGNKKAERKVRQITVQSINAEHRVWIDVLPSETGLTLAEKIHVIATFRTRKIVSITTASGRKIPLDNRPVFGSWMDMESFEDGERWIVEWRENDRSVVDRFLSKMVQASGGKRKSRIAKDSNKE